MWSGQSPDVSYQWAIFHFDGNTTRQVTPYDVPAGDPHVSGDRIVWLQTDSDGFQDVYSYDGNTTTQLTDTGYSESQLDISGDYTVWRGASGDVFLHDGTTTARIFDGRSSDSPQGPKVDDGRVAWYLTYDPGVYYYDGNVTTQISEGYGDNVEISGERVVWDERVDGVSQIFLYYHGEVHQLTHGATNSRGPDIVGDLVVWKTDNGPGYDIYKMVVPEPATMSLLALGGVAVLRRKRRA